MPKPELTQKELSDEFSKGNSFVLQFKTAYEIKWSHGTQQFVLIKRLHIKNSLPFTKAGRFIFANRKTTEKMFYKPINQES